MHAQEHFVAAGTAQRSIALTGGRAISGWLLGQHPSIFATVNLSHTAQGKQEPWQYPLPTSIHLHCSSSGLTTNPLPTTQLTYL